MAAKRKPTIAIDGPAGAGKSTVAKLVAEKLGLLYVDSGAMYRAASWLVHQRGLKVEDWTAIAKAVDGTSIELLPGSATDPAVGARHRHARPKSSTAPRSAGILPASNPARVHVNGKDITNKIRSPSITHLVIAVSEIPEVRDSINVLLRGLAKDGGVVMDGRDIGTVVLPDADLKIFLTASVEVRARRRLKDLQAAGEKVELNNLIEQIKIRDQRNTTRPVAPLKQAEDAVAINTDNLTIDEVVSRILGLASKLPSKNRSV